MHDMNFFAGVKRGKLKNKSFLVFLIVFLVVAALVTAVIIGGGLYLFRGLEEDIQSMQDYINDPATQQSIKDAERMKHEADLTAQYLNLIKSVDYKFEQLDFINTDLLMHLRELTPENTVFTSAQVNGINISLNCESIDPNGPMDMYHAFRNSPRLNNVILAAISITDEVVSFAITCEYVVEGGEQP